MVLPVRIELTTSALPRMRSTTELRQHSEPGEAPGGGRGLCAGIGGMSSDRCQIAREKRRKRHERCGTQGTVGTGIAAEPAPSQGTGAGRCRERAAGGPSRGRIPTGLSPAGALRCWPRPSPGRCRLTGGNRVAEPGRLAVKGDCVVGDPTGSERSGLSGAGASAVGMRKPCRVDRGHGMGLP